MRKSDPATGLPRAREHNDGGLERKRCGMAICLFCTSSGCGDCNFRQSSSSSLPSAKCFNTFFFSSFRAASRLPRVAHGMLCGFCDVEVEEVEDVEEVEEDRGLLLFSSCSEGT